MYTAKLMLHGITIMARHGKTRREAVDALGGVEGPGYHVVVTRRGELS